mgnify:CR=1 FL=1
MADPEDLLETRNYAGTLQGPLLRYLEEEDPDELEKLMAPDGQLQKHRQAVQQLSAEALKTQASLETLRREQETLDTVRDELRQPVGLLHGGVMSTLVESVCSRATSWTSCTSAADRSMLEGMDLLPSTPDGTTTSWMSTSRSISRL